MFDSLRLGIAVGEWSGDAVWGKYRLLFERQPSPTSVAHGGKGCQREYHEGKRLMPLMFTFKPIGFVKSPFKETSSIPRGLGAKHDAEGALEILPEFEAGLMDIEGFSHLYVLWAFDRAVGFDLIAHPPTDEKRPHGVFATRSPRRPNPIALSTVELLGRDGPSLRVRGVDMLDGTPILDIKPYLSSIAPEKLKRGWLAEAEAR
ncbi:MAG TPA: tRNA (N6-threonylcarbamoyladenosine(37)-N6)-methyltransferase TrmO, partial [Terracidiphilus sp.]|nr:tRNA (N6-threonylcarbamoyladenosine(37)-N6)-methyltransferase TrmO [Terracidiphilus sp.]